MGTRSILAVPMGDGWQGRYCHWDGYPTHHGAVLVALVARDGLDMVRHTLTDRYAGWSSVNPERFTLGEYETDGRFRSVKGYGIAYSSDPVDHPSLGKGYRQADMSEWIRSTDADFWGTEWLYVMGDAHLMIAPVMMDSTSGPDGQRVWTSRAELECAIFVPWSISLDRLGPILETYEAGSRFYDESTRTVRPDLCILANVRTALAEPEPDQPALSGLAEVR